MAEFKTVIAVDGMGGDNAPVEIVKGVVDAVNMRTDVKVLLTGTKDAIEAELAKYTYNKEQIELIATTEVIAMAEPPVVAIRTKKDSSLRVALDLVKEGKADAVVSAGSTGAILAGGQLVVGRTKGIKRPPLAPLIPTANGVSLLIDCGANVDADPINLVQFARMGSVYMSDVLGVKNPKVGIINIGAEEEKGNALVKATFPLLKECEDINFIGSVEARDIPQGVADVYVCDAFVGNVVLKLTEGLAGTLIAKIKGGLMTSLKTKIGALLIKPALKATLKGFDATKYGGAPLLGLKGLVVKTHGSAKAIEVTNTIMQCLTFKEQDILGKIARKFEEE